MRALALQPTVVEPTPPSARFAAADLCVTSGALLPSGEELAVDSSQFRAVAARTGDTDAELHFTYLGPTVRVAELGSGQIRTQLGLKLPRGRRRMTRVAYLVRIASDRNKVLLDSFGCPRCRADSSLSPECCTDARVVYTARRPMIAVTIDHVALPCFDVSATHAFYAGILGLPLVHAQSGSAEAWGAGEYLLLAYGLHEGNTIDFFAFDGIVRPPPDGLPKDIRHLALTVRTRVEVTAYKERFAAAAMTFWTETHDVDDIHVYVMDPNGVVLEIVAQEDSSRARGNQAADPARVLEQWLRKHGPEGGGLSSMRASFRAWQK
jgi:glyoxylase I family protein